MTQIFFEVSKLRPGILLALPVESTPVHIVAGIFIPKEIRSAIITKKN